jgi:hypothetical protein
VQHQKLLRKSDISLASPISRNIPKSRQNWKMLTGGRSNASPRSFMMKKQEIKTAKHSPAPTKKTFYETVSPMIKSAERVVRNAFSTVNTK